MKVNSILFPTDFSHYNDAALEYACTLAAEANAKLYIVHVHDLTSVDPTWGEAGFIHAEERSWEDAVSRRQLEKVKPTVSSVKFEQHFLTGRPGTAIVDFAADNKVDLIVMASHGRSGLSRLLMGSIAEDVMRKAPCPVLIVKQPTPAKFDPENVVHASHA
jgi:nucleotide-binding universal stress UspA family protein